MSCGSSVSELLGVGLRTPLCTSPESSRGVHGCAGVALLACSMSGTLPAGDVAKCPSEVWLCWPSADASPAAACPGAERGVDSVPPVEAGCCVPDGPGGRSILALSCAGSCAAQPAQSVKSQAQQLTPPRHRRAGRRRLSEHASRALHTFFTSLFAPRGDDKDDD